MSSTINLSLSTTSTGSTTNSTPVHRLAHRIKNATLECLAGAILRIVDLTSKPEKSTLRNCLKKRSRKKGGRPYCSSGFAMGFVNSWEEVWNSGSKCKYITPLDWFTFVGFLRCRFLLYWN